MARALELARRGIALAHPNPIVGAVLVKNGRVVGEGFHEYDKRDHAEIVALKQAGSKARGSPCTSPLNLAATPAAPALARKQSSRRA